jgi:hypothetical protein
MKRIIFVTITFLLLVSVNADPRTSWYDVEDWEVDVCSKWGGHGLAEQSAAIEGEVTFGDMTFAVQAQKSRLFNNTLYEIAFYIESFSAVSHYDLSLVNEPKALKKLLRSGDLVPKSGLSEFIVEESREEYTHIQLVTEKGKVLLPVVAR